MKYQIQLISDAQEETWIANSRKKAIQFALKELCGPRIEVSSFLQRKSKEAYAKLTPHHINEKFKNGIDNIGIFIGATSITEYKYYYIIIQKLYTHKLRYGYRMEPHINDNDIIIFPNDEPMISVEHNTIDFKAFLEKRKKEYK